MSAITVGVRPAALRPTAWLALGASAAAIAGVGLAATVAILAGVDTDASTIPVSFWIAVVAAAAATCASLAVRTWRWIFLLRRANTRIPLGDACIGYLSGFSLLLVPLLAGELAARAYVHRTRARVPLSTTFVLTLWDRLLDVSGLAVVAACAAGLLAGPRAALIPLTIVAAMSTRSFRGLALAGGTMVSNVILRRMAPEEQPARSENLERLTHHGTWVAALAASAAAWTLPAVGLWWLARSWTTVVGLAQAQLAFASSALAGGLTLAPGGTRVVGTSLIEYLTAGGLTQADAVITVLAIRLATAGLATILGVIFVGIHLRRPSTRTRAHFDEIAHTYDAQIPAAQRESLLARKTALMRHTLERYGVGRRGLDAGCGQGWYVVRMRELGFDVNGIDTSPEQIARARTNVGDAAVIAAGSVLHIDAAAGAYDFVYTINVLHHLESLAEQRAAFAELLRVIKPGGLLFVHEINTRNALFRFYMGYIFPSLNCIDEGTERWLLPHRLAAYTAAPVLGTEYFTFMPEFVPRIVLRGFRPIEALLEACPLRVFSAHYMAVLQKQA